MFLYFTLQNVNVNWNNLVFSGKLLEYAKEQEANGNSIEETVSSLPTPDIEIADSLQKQTSNTQCGIHNKYSEERRRGNNQPWALKIIGNIHRDHEPYNLLRRVITFQCFQITHI